MNADLGGEDSRWLIVEDGFTAARANVYETLFTNRQRLPRHEGLPAGEP